jgi:hypothetical protein
MEKMAYAVVMAKRKLQHYFQSHNISASTAFPLRDMLENMESTGRMGKWATELAEHVINFVARSAIKSQVLADFVADYGRSDGAASSSSTPRHGLQYQFYDFTCRFPHSITLIPVMCLTECFGGGHGFEAA